MKTSRSVGYALLAVSHVAQTGNKDKLVRSQDIAKKFKIPLEYLLKIMQSLVKVNILRSKRGPTGGFSLAQPLSKISMLQVIEAVDGPMGVSLGFEDLKMKDSFAAKAQKVYETAQAGTTKVLITTKLSTLCGTKK